MAAEPLVPLQVQHHQLVDVEAEADVGDGAAGVGLTGGWTQKVIRVQPKLRVNIGAL